QLRLRGVGWLAHRSARRAPGRLDAGLGVAVGGLGGGDPFLVGELADPQHRVVDPGDVGLGGGPVVAPVLVGDVDHAARVGDVVGHVEDAGGGEAVVVLVGGQLVVR